nr:ras-related protein Rab-37 isoform X2 [Manis javanica]
MMGTPGSAAAREGEAPDRSPPCSPSYDLTGKVMLLGDSGVGKTCFLIQFKDGAFLSGTFIATVGIDFRVRWQQAPPPSSKPGGLQLQQRGAAPSWLPWLLRTAVAHCPEGTRGAPNKVVTVDGVRVKLQIWDTAGQERFRSVTHAYYRDAQALLLLYDITNKSSFDNIRAWLTEIHEYAQRDVVIMLLGNKTQRLPAEGGQYLLLGQKRARRGREGPAGVKISFSRVTHLGLTGRCEQRKGDPFGGWGDTGQGVWGSLHGDQR